MKEHYIIHIDGKKKKKLTTYQEALRYVKSNYGDMTVRMDWEPRGSGGVDLWDNGISTIMIEKCYPDGIDLVHLAKEHTRVEKEEMERDSESEDDEIIDKEEKKKMPYTPRRTTLRMKRKKKVSVMKIGDVKEGEDGNMYICKEKSNGKLYWTRYVQKTYKGAPIKKDTKKTRKCPSKPAKEYDPGTVKKGEDGKMWMVKEMSNGNHRWFRKSK